MTEPERTRPGAGPVAGGAVSSAARRRRTGERLVALFAVGVVLLNFPLLSVIRGRGPVAGLPAAFVYLFVVWGLLALATALVLRRRPSEPREAGDEPRRRP